MDILGGIKKAFQMMPVLAGSIGALVMTLVILGMVAGVFVYQATTAGNINIDGNSTALITATTANFSAFAGTLWSAVTAVTGFIVIGVVVVIALALLGKKFLRGGGM